MVEQPSIKIFIGRKEEAIHQYINGPCVAMGPNGKLLYVSFEIIDKDPKFQEQIAEVTVEAIGINEEEKEIVVRQLASEMKYRIREAALIYLKNQI